MQAARRDDGGRGTRQRTRARGRSRPRRRPSAIVVDGSHRSIVMLTFRRRRRRLPTRQLRFKFHDQGDNVEN
jgi:hypothetical protein